MQAVLKLPIPLPDLHEGEGAWCAQRRTRLSPAWALHPISCLISESSSSVVRSQRVLWARSSEWPITGGAGGYLHEQDDY